MVDHARAHKALLAINALLSPGGQATAAYTAIRGTFVSGLSSAAQTFIDGGDRRSTTGSARQVIVKAYGAVADLIAGGPLEPDDLRMYNELVQIQIDALEGFWSDLRAQAKAGNPVLPSDRVEVYARSLDGLYNSLRASAQKSTIVEWRVGPTEESCKDCSRLDGQQHRLRWFLDKGYIPGRPGTDALACKGYQCLCSWLTLDGQPFSYTEAA